MSILQRLLGFRIAIAILLMSKHFAGARVQPEQVEASVQKHGAPRENVGDLILDELNQHFDLNLVHSEVETVGGLIMAMLGRVPAVGDRVDVDDAVFEVQTMDGMAVLTAKMSLPHGS